MGLFALQSEALPQWSAKGDAGHIGGPWGCDLFWFPCLESWMVTFGHLFSAHLYPHPGVLSEHVGKWNFLHHVP